MDSRRQRAGESSEALPQGMFASVAVYPGQCGDSGRGLSASIPERALAAAVLECAIDDLRALPAAPRSAEGRAHQDAWAWVMSEDRTWPYAFENLCEVLGLSATSVRAELWRRYMAREPERPEGFSLSEAS